MDELTDMRIHKLDKITWRTLSKFLVDPKLDRFELLCAG
jgi:hypothetical protein